MVVLAGLTLSLISPSKSVKKCCPTPLIVGKQNGFILISRSFFCWLSSSSQKLITKRFISFYFFACTEKKPPKNSRWNLNGKTTFVFLSNFYSSFTCMVDNNVFRFHYKVTFLFLVVSSLMVTSRQFIGDPITCIVEQIPNNVSFLML